MLPQNTANILLHITGDLLWEVVDRRGSLSIENWESPTPQPTEAEIIARGQTQAFLDWEGENGGDPTLTARRIVKEAIDDPAGKVLVALVKVMIDQGIIAATPQQVRNAIVAKIEAGEAD